MLKALSLKSRESAVSSSLEGSYSAFLAVACPHRAALTELRNSFEAAHAPAWLSTGSLRGSLLALGRPYFPTVQVKSCIYTKNMQQAGIS